MHDYHIVHNGGHAACWYWEKTCEKGKRHILIVDVISWSFCIAFTVCVWVEREVSSCAWLAHTEVPLEQYKVGSASDCRKHLKSCTKPVKYGRSLHISHTYFSYQEHMQVRRLQYWCVCTTSSYSLLWHSTNTGNLPYMYTTVYILSIG